MCHVVIRLPSNRLPRRVLYGELLHGKHPLGAPKKRFRDYIKTVLKKSSIPFATLEVSAGDRVRWKEVCEAALGNLLQSIDQAAADRDRRHQSQRASATSTVPKCQVCGRICKSDFGLRSHMRAHNRPSWFYGASSSSISMDNYKQASKQAMHNMWSWPIME